MNKIIYISFSIAIIFSSCTSILEPTVERVEDVDLVEMTKSKLELNAFMVLKNPNGFALDLDAADITVFADNVELAKINQAYETSMPQNGEFRMPVNINLDLDKLYRNSPLQAISNGLKIMSDKKITLDFKGTIMVGKGIAKVSVPIDQQEEVKF